MKHDYADQGDFYQRGPYRRFLQDKCVLGSSSVTIFHAEQPDGHYPDPAFPNSLLYLCLKGAREVVFDWGAGKWRGQWRAGDLTLVPPKSSSDVMLSERHSFIAICLPDDVQFSAALYAAPFRDELVGQLCRALWHERSSVGALEQLFTDHALHCLTARLGALRVKEAKERSLPRFSARLMTEVRNYVETNCGRKISVADLAMVAGCGVSRFNEIFGRTAGMSPYRFVTELRLQRARQLLTEAMDQSITEIALATGFSSQSHLTAAYRKAFGEPPGRTRSQHVSLPLRC